MIAVKVTVAMKCSLTMGMTMGMMMTMMTMMMVMVAVPLDAEEIKYGLLYSYASDDECTGTPFAIDIIPNPTPSHL